MRKIETVLVLIVVVSLIGAVLTVQANAKQEWKVYPKTDKGMWDFIHDAQDNWVYEGDYPGESCQRPAVSNQRLKGDCDDFAVMIAYYLQEYWGYDTFIVLINMKDTLDHYVAFVHASESLKESMSKKCTGYYPYRISNNRVYIPIDWDLCPDWKWINEGPSNVKEWEWHELVERPI